MTKITQYGFLRKNSMNQINKTIPFLLVINTILFVISLSIAFIVLFRPFYYWQIKPLKIEEKTGYTYQEIKEAYDDVLDYCLWNKEFKIGNLRYSESGKDHFKDCKRLFMINFIILIGTTIILILRRKDYKKIKIKKHSINYWSGISIIIVFISILLITITVGFNTIFNKFHYIFFYGKNNWLFDSYKDEIIKILPEQFFMNCAILIFILIITISIILIIKDIIKQKEIGGEL